jgi:hypothetical protein
MRGKLKPLSIVSLILSLHSCDARVGTAHFDISAKTPDGKPVSGALVILDGEEIGQTNAFGTFVVDAKLPVDKFHKISITKDDIAYYYAPYFETFKVVSGATKAMPLSPTMYIVPKPRPTRSEKTQASNVADLPSSPASTAATPQLDNSPHPLELLNKLPLLSLPEASLAIGVASVPAAKTTQSMFTIHVYNGRSILTDSDVTWITSHNSEPVVETKCVTNDRGRCIINSNAQNQTEGTLLVEHAGFKSVARNISLTSNSNTRISLDPGRSISLKTLEVTPWRQKPLDGVTIRQHGAIVATTNAQGIAVVDVRGGAPGPLELESLSQKTIIHVTPSLQQSAQLVAKFPAPAKTSWPIRLLYPLHVSSDVKQESDLVGVALGEGTLITTAEATKSDLPPSRWIDLPTDSIALLPVLQVNEGRYSLKICAFTHQGMIATSEPVVLRNPRLSDSWKRTSDQAIKSLLQKMPWPGLVSSIQSGHITLSINPQFIHKEDRVAIDSPEGLLTAKVTSVTNDNVQAKLLDSPQNGSPMSSANEWTLMGASARKITLDDLELAKSKSEFVSLKMAGHESRSLRLAKKLLVENNTAEALKELLKITEVDANNLPAMQMKASISRTLGNSADVMRDLYKILEISAASGLKNSALGAEINLIRTQTENLFVVPGDKTIAARFGELADQSHTLKAEVTALGSRFANGALMLEFNAILARRKKAECEEDLIALATLPAVWSDFEATLDDYPWSPTETALWKKIVRQEIANVALAPDSVEKPM